MTSLSNLEWTFYVKYCFSAGMSLKRGFRSLAALTPLEIETNSCGIVRFNCDSTAFFLILFCGPIWSTYIFKFANDHLCVFHFVADQILQATRGVLPVHLKSETTELSYYITSKTSRTLKL